MDILLDHQKTAYKKMHNGCILKGATGTGKTITALAYYDDNETVERLIVITTGKKRDSGDWQAEARLFGIIPEVDSWNNISKYVGIEGAFFIFDEQRVVGSGPWVKSFIKITKKNQWILLSATPGDSWLDYIPVFVANGFYRNRTDFLQQHVEFDAFSKYPKVKRYHGVQTLIRHLDSILVSMPYQKHTKRHEIFVGCEYDRVLYDTVWRRRWNYIEERPVRHIAEVFALIRRITNSDPSRLERVRDLMIKHPKLIIFYNFDYELTALRGMLDEREVTYAEWNGHRHDSVPEGREWIYLVQYGAGSEGWNCTETDAEIFFSLTYSYRQFHQAKGRIDRLNTSFTDLYYYVLRSVAPIDSGIVSNLSQKRNFNEKRFMAETV
jgi:hypothetical protein